MLFAREVDQEGICHIDTYNEWLPQNLVGRVACTCKPAVAPELVQILPSTTQRALGTQLMFLLEFAYPRKPTERLLRGLGVRDKTAYGAEFIDGFVGRRLLPI